ncbi:MAG: DEAD/DEAH box helicase [Thermoplasmata archaeon]
MRDLCLTPSGHLRWMEVASPENESAPEPAAERVGAAWFAHDPGEGLLRLATLPADEELSAVLTYWKRFGELYLEALCRVPESASGPLPPVPPPREKLAEMVGGAPPMQGGEYLRPEAMERIWTELDAYARRGIAACPGGLAPWLNARSPLWHRVGRVCFHLAENKHDAERPFAFLATYAPRLLDGHRVQYQPLGRALEEHAHAENRPALARLLAPVQEASGRCPWVKTLVDSGELFHPLRWTPEEAYRLLKDVPLLEASGLLVRVPDWWSKRPARVRVTASVGRARGTAFTAQSMLDFRVDLAVEGEPLTPSERATLLAGGDGLRYLKGRWVEVDRERLQEALALWKKVKRSAPTDGISFLEGMRLLAGASLQPELTPLLEGESAAWSEVRAGPWLAERLRAMRAPEALRGALPGPDLHATLRPYQETGVRWLNFLTQLGLGACLADDMGLGKTIQVIALLLVHKKQSEGKGGPALLVLPASLLANWKSEIDRFAPSLRIRVAHPSRESVEALARAAAEPSRFVAGLDAVLTSYGMLVRQEWFTSVPWSAVVLDEAQAIKNPGSRQSQVVKRLRAEARIALTGTPVENRLTDLWSIFDFLSPGLLGSHAAFREFVKRLDRRPEEPYAPLRQLVAPYLLRRVKTDRAVISDLPDKTEVKVFCPLARKQAALYEEAVQELAGSLAGAEGIERRGVVLAFLLRFKQICNHPSQWLAEAEYPPQESGKFVRLQGLCEEIAARQEKVLVYTQFRTLTEPLARFLESSFGRPGLVLHGQVAVKRRQQLVDAFQREDGPPFFVLSLKAGGTGLNLTAASHVIHFDRWWNPAVENQATDRAYRIGQKRNVMVHKFICQGTIEERIDAMLGEKSTLAGEILEGGGSPMITEMSDRELLELVRLDAAALGED